MKFASTIGYLFLFAAMLQLGCLRDYSYEGGPGPDSTSANPLPDVPDPASQWTCTACRQSGLPDSSWRFETSTAIYCGTVTGAVITPDRTAFTFFGPSRCSGDSGLIMTVYLSHDTLNHDAANILTEKIVFQYYDNVTPSFMLQSKPIPGFTFIIDQYKQQGATASGHFSGPVFSTAGSIVNVSQGSFRIHFR